MDSIRKWDPNGFFDLNTNRIPNPASGLRAGIYISHIFYPHRGTATAIQIQGVANIEMGFHKISKVEEINTYRSLVSTAVDCHEIEISFITTA